MKLTPAERQLLEDVRTVFDRRGVIYLDYESSGTLMKLLNRIEAEERECTADRDARH